MPKRHARRSRIDCAEISEQDKRRVLRENAAALFGMLGGQTTREVTR